MNREIKFRAWDTEKKEMCYDGHIDQYDDGFDSGSTSLSICFNGQINAQIGDDGGKNGLWEHDANIKKDRLILMQYTGLKDKNGKEIYEGDIVKNLEHGHVFSVEWGIENESYAGWSGVWQGKTFVAPLYNGPLVNCEIIGNIYENPELLK